MKPRALLRFATTCILVIVLGGCGREEPEAKERKALTSPNGRLQARIAVLDLGATMRLQQLFITPSGTSVKLTGRETAGMIAATVDACQDGNFEARWISDDKLAITFMQDRPGWVNYVTRVQGVTIVLENRSQ